MLEHREGVGEGGVLPVLISVLLSSRRMLIGQLNDIDSLMDHGHCVKDKSRLS